MPSATSCLWCSGVVSVAASDGSIELFCSPECQGLFSHTLRVAGYEAKPAREAMPGQSRDYLMLLNFERGVSAIPLSQVEAANAKPGIESVVPFGQLTGLEPTSVPLAGAIRIDNLDDQYGAYGVLDW